MNKKHIVIAIVGLLLTVMETNTQAQRRNFDPEKRAERFSGELQKALELDEATTLKVRELDKARAKSLSELRQKQSADRSQMRNEVQAINEQFRTNLKGVLTAEQWTKFEAWKKDRMTERKTEGRHSKHGGRGRRHG
ncbi:MAG: hypothetical protein ACK4GN_14545 [Runella sp.]